MTTLQIQQEKGGPWSMKYKGKVSGKAVLEEGWSLAPLHLILKCEGKVSGKAVLEEGWSSVCLHLT